MKVLILAGGKGTRLWPLSRSRFPKQFLKLGGEKTLLQQTIQRFLTLVSEDDIFILTCSEYYQQVLCQARELAPSIEMNIFLEPAPKNTAPAMAYAVKLLKERGIPEDELLFVTPSDHLIAPVESFVSSVQTASKLALKTKGIVTFGVHPTRPETGYGYIHAKENKVLAFVEKPSREKAESYLFSGNYTWNSGMFLFSMETFVKELHLHAPALSSFILEDQKKNFSKLPSISIDYAVMEKSSALWVCPLNLTWSDVGSWENVYEAFDKDEQENVTFGDTLCQETTRSLVLAEKRLVATIGLDQMLVVETDDVVLVAKREDAQKVRQCVEKLLEKGKKQVNEHSTMHRPWGSYTILEESARYKIKRIQVSPQQKLSLQLHYHRSEHWIVATGTAKVTINDKECLIHEGESIFVPKSAVHRLENPGKVLLELIEVQVGEYLGEDDIVRLEDIYGRLKEEEAFQLLVQNRSFQN